MPAPPNNTNARKPADQRADAQLTIRLPRVLKGKIVAAARPGKMATWVIAACRDRLAADSAPDDQVDAPSGATAE